MSATEAWSRDEVEAVVSDYFQMLMQELVGQIYNKTAHRHALQTKLHGRSDGSVERKHQNISAILIELGSPYIAGYKPLGNYQGLLFDVVADRFTQDRLFDKTAISAVEQSAAAPLQHEFSKLLVDPPKVDFKAQAAPAPYRVQMQGIKRDYLERESRNQSLGAAGERFVVAYERARLHSLNRGRLTDKVEHVSATKGDGLGYDVLSFEVDGRERFIEVKTTAFGKETPFFISRNEVDFSAAVAKQFHLYRLFDFRKLPRMFDLKGSVRHQCLLDAVNFVARFS